MPRQQASGAPDEFGIIGLGQIGGNIARQALEAGFRVAGSTRRSPPEELLRQGLVALDDPGGLRAALQSPRLVFLWVPAGPVVDHVLEEVAAALEPGDVIADGGNSYWGDSISRHARLRSVASASWILARAAGCLARGGAPASWPAASGRRLRGLSLSAARWRPKAASSMPAGPAAATS
jgi:class 3 adenylate cyclase